MLFKSKIKWFALVTLLVSSASILVHLHLARYSREDIVQIRSTSLLDDDFTLKLGKHTMRYKKLWGSIKSLESLQPFANPRSKYPVPNEKNNGFIYAKIYGGFEKIQSAIVDLVTVARLLNATLVIPEIQESGRAKGISSRFKSFSYLYDEEQFIAALVNDVIVVRKLPQNLQEARKKKKISTFSPKNSASPDFYIRDVLPKLKKSFVIGLLISEGGRLQSILPSSMAEYQRLRCRVAFHALKFRSEIRDLGLRIVERLRAFSQPYLVFHPGLVRDTLAYHGCAELFQDIHTELIQYRRAQMIKQGIVHEELSVESHFQRKNGSCPLLPEEVGLLLRAMGYPSNTMVYVVGSETFGGQRVLIPLCAIFTNLVDRTSLCSAKELSDLIGPETPLPSDLPRSPPANLSEKELIGEWKKAGLRPRPLPPPPARPIYRHEKEGWYGWIAEMNHEPDPSPADLRLRAHRLLWDALDYIVSVEADAFFPGFNNDGSGWPDFSSLVMGQRLYEMASARTYRPDRKTLIGLFDDIKEHMYHPKRNWTFSVREHLNKSLSEDGLMIASQLSKPNLFLSHPLPECSCRTSGFVKGTRPIKGSPSELLYTSLDVCPEWMQRGLETISIKDTNMEGEVADESELLGDDADMEEQPESNQGGSTSESDDEMDPDD
ncbi:LOW QUALITY PROTEIN: protein EMBRYO SAC DEVELOPMENT ARREST 30-like [Aristolochia californica]|uniref:LOW QUALITY PROTEIN: protein EMBRYO SAC DEVELOPMENT ARREST 30-like n=1 Tax=Aristolochia californica TaxID=171875 RepID=UPI0035DF46BF